VSAGKVAVLRGFRLLNEAPIHRNKMLCLEIQVEHATRGGRHWYTMRRLNDDDCGSAPEQFQAKHKPGTVLYVWETPFPSATEAEDELFLEADDAYDFLQRKLRHDIKRSWWMTAGADGGKSSSSPRRRHVE